MKEVHSPPAVVIDPSVNLTDMVERRAQDTRNPVVYRVQKSTGNWVNVTAQQFRAQVLELAKGLVAAGIGAGDVVGIMSRTRYEWTLIDFACWYAGAVVVPVYETSSPAQAAWALSHSKAKAVFVESDKLAGVIDQARNLTDEELEHLMVEEAKLWLDSGKVFGPETAQFERFNLACLRATVVKAMEQLKAALDVHIRWN